MSKISRRRFVGNTGAGVIATVTPLAGQAAEQPTVPRSKIDLVVSGAKKSVEVEDRTTLAELLRDRLNLTGAKIGCGRGECGAPEREGAAGAEPASHGRRCARGAVRQYLPVFQLQPLCRGRARRRREIGITPLQRVGHATPRIDIVQRVTGAATYTGGVQLPGMLYSLAKNKCKIPLTKAVVKRTLLSLGAA